MKSFQKLKSVIRRSVQRIVSWWRRITGRDRYIVGLDPAYGPDKSAWSLYRYDTKTGTITVLESGIGEPPANARTERPEAAEL